MRDGMAVRTGRGARNMRNTGRRRGQAGSQWARALATLALRNPGAVLGGVIFAAALTAVSVNALTLQNAPHPAPLFSGGASQERAGQESAAQSAPRAATAPVAAPRLNGPDDASSDTPTQSAQPAPSIIAPPTRAADAPRSIGDLLAAPVPPTRPETSDSNTAAGTSPGSIAALLADGDGPTRTGSTGPTGPDSVIASAQRALDDLGYGPLTADGLYGPMTREAIERFESDHGLTVTGQLVPATAQMLARESGIAIE